MAATRHPAIEADLLRVPDDGGHERVDGEILSPDDVVSGFRCALRDVLG